MKRATFLALVLVMAMVAAHPTQAQLRSAKYATGWPPGFTFVPMLVAMEKGMLKEEGLQFSFDVLGRVADTVKLVATGKYPFTGAALMSVIQAREKGLPVIAIGAWFQKNPTAIVSKVEKGLTKMEDLRGKKVGVPSLGSSDYYALRAAMAKAKIGEKDLSLITVGHGAATALAQGKVDAIVGFVTSQAARAQAIGLKVNMIRIGDYVNIGSYQYISSERFLKSDPGVIKSFVRSMNRAKRYALDHPDEAFKMVTKYFPKGKQGSRLELKHALELLQDANTRKFGLGWQSKEGWLTAQQVLLSLGLIKKKEPVERMFTNKYITPEIK